MTDNASFSVSQHRVAKCMCKNKFGTCILSQGHKTYQMYKMLKKLSKYSMQIELL